MVSRKIFLLVSFFWVATFFLENVNAQQLAFPGAEGFGKYSKGGRGGDVYEVTNLNDNGAGSFRQGVTAYGTAPLTVVFKVSGTIELLSNIKISRSNLTIAGQTAPGDGICFKNYSLILNGAKIGGNHGNIVIRYIRSRPGGTVSTGLYGFDMENCQNVIIDHCSFSWANEEVAAMYDTKNISVQYCILSEGLYSAGHAKGVRSYCGVWGGQYSSYHHNLIAHNVSRTIRFDGARAHDTMAVIDYRNNVIYNWGSSGACYGGEVLIPGGVSQVNIVNNYYKPGPATSTTQKFLAASYATPDYGVGQWYVNGNVMAGNAGLTANNWLGVDVSANPVAYQSQAKVSVPFTIAQPLPDENAVDAYAKVLLTAGAILPKRDSIDRRIVNETNTGTATGMGTYNKLGIIDAPSAVGGYAIYNSTTAPDDNDHDGMADNWELVQGLNPGDASDRNTVGIEGYSMLEVYLNSIAGSHMLPLTLLSFDAKILQWFPNKIQLKWSTTNEINTKKFIVERSLDGLKFNAIAELPSQNTDGDHFYEYKDNMVGNGNFYYRLRQLDIDGKFQYSHIIEVNIKSNRAVGLYPNPVNNSFTCSHPASSNKETIKLLSNTGELIKNFVTTPNSNQTNIDVSNLNPGVYLLNYIKDKESLVLKFIKQ